MNRKKKLGLAVLLILLAALAGFGWTYVKGKDQTTEKKLSSIRMLIDQYYLEDTEDTEFEEGIYKGYVEQLGDPYSVYYTKEEYKKLVEEDSGHYEGIGIVVSQNIETGKITVTRVFKDSPAAKAGIQRYDVISAVDGVSTADMELTEVVKKIRGGVGETVELTILRDNEELKIESERGKVESQMVESQMMDDQIGYIAIYEFISNTYEQFHEAYEELEGQGMKALVLDLRSNPGGLLDQVQKVADDFIPEGSVIVST